MKMAIGVVLIVAGVLALEKEHVNIPVWAGAIAIAGGVVLLLADRKK